MPITYALKYHLWDTSLPIEDTNQHIGINTVVTVTESDGVYICINEAPFHGQILEATADNPDQAILNWLAKRIAAAQAAHSPNAGEAREPNNLKT